MGHGPHRPDPSALLLLDRCGQWRHQRAIRRQGRGRVFTHQLLQWLRPSPYSPSCCQVDPAHGS